MTKIKTIKEEDLVSLFPSDKTRRNNNHLITTCPWCNKERHFYVNIRTQLFDCKKCGEVGNIFKILHKLGKLFLLGEFKSIDRFSIKSLKKEGEDEESVFEEAVKRKMPIGFKRIYSDWYMKKRRISKTNSKKAIMGYTNLVPSLKDYFIMGIYEDGECKGYLARYTKKINKGETIPRYLNDRGAVFKNLLGGYDEIVESKTKTVILLEGYFDKLTLDDYLELNNQTEIKACCTFGKKVSYSQIVKLLIKGVENVILLMDEDAIPEMKKYAAELDKHFNTLVGYSYGKDINDSKIDEVLPIFKRLQTPNEFYRKNVRRIKK